MKKGKFNFMGRKNQSLFDTNIKIKEIDNVDLVLDSSAIPESGTAKVRSRPTVKHYTSSSDVVQGFAVPTPKVPVIPPFNGLKTNGSVSGDRLSNGSAISVPDLVEGEILVPPPPSVAPPPPPSVAAPPPPVFLLPPPEFMGDLDSVDMAALQPPSMPPPKPPSLAPSQEEEYLTSLKPPPMAPPKPPSISFSTTTSSLPTSTPPPTTVPDLSECPKFAPPQPPTERQHKTQRPPPQKPTRLSSIPSIDGPPLGPAPAPLAQNPTPSSFNPQNTAKIYSVPKTSILGGHVADREKRPKQILLLEDSGSGNSVRMPVQINGKAPSMAPPTKPVHKNSAGTQLEKDLQELKENLQATLPSQTPQTQPKKEAKVETVSTQQEISTLALTSPKDSPKLQKAPIAPVNSDANQVKLEESPGRGRQFSPLIERKLRNLKSSEPSGARGGPAASPLALLMAAKEREKHRSSLSRENSTKKDGQSTASIQPSDSSPNSFIVIPRSTSSSSLTNPPLSVPSTATSSPASNLAVGKQSLDRGPSSSECVRDEENGEELCIPLLPPPPEFANFDDFNEDIGSPPSSPPPDPPMKRAPPPPTSPPPPPPTICPVPPAQAPSPPPKPKPPAPPSFPPTKTDVKPKLLPQTKSKVPSTPAPSSLSASQATLLSILQKKMLEMDHKIVPVKETEPSSDDWGSPLSDEDTKVPVFSRAAPKNKASTLPIRTVGLDMRELESKVAKKTQDKFSSKGSISNGPQSKHQHGMTFTVRPGTKQPITLYSKGDSS